VNPAILIVDDSLTVRMDLDEAFAADGFRTSLCDDAALARRALERDRFDAVILDPSLPDESGLELLAGLRKNTATAQLPVILLSSEAEVSDRVRGLEAGATDYVGKPYDRGYLVARTRELMRRTGSQSPAKAAKLVLVVDDSTTVREELRSALEGEGYAVVEAASGEEGLQVAFNRRPAAAIIDGMLPGMDGAAVVRRLRDDAALRRTPCILLTAAEERLGELAALEEGADAYVRKDQGLHVVLARLRTLLRSASAPAGLDTPAPSVLGPKRILAVDDSPTYLQELASQLRQDGYEVVQASSGEEALRLLAVQQVDCILMDLVMPGMSGKDACRAIKSDPSRRAVPLIIVTAQEEREAMLEAIEAEADDFVAKSSHFHVLRARLHAQLRRTQLEHENRLLAEHERFEQAAEILETIPDAFMALDDEARIVYANGPALELTGRQREDVRGALLWDVLAHLIEPAFRTEIDDALALARPGRFLRRLHRPGKPWYEVRAFPRERGFIFYLRDVTERMNAEEALREADRRKNEFLAMLSHELRNPLMPVKNSLVILERADPNGEQARRAKDVLGRQVGLLARLVDDLLDLTRISRGKIQLQRSRFELADLVRRTTEDYASLFTAGGLNFEVHMDVDSLWVDGDAARIAQAIGNLLQNAAKFTPRGGQVALSLERDTLERRAVIRVRDTGVGFDDRALEHLFEPFEQVRGSLDRSQGGLGLGLALVKGLIENHGGSVEARSDGSGRGAEFVVRLPLQHVAAAEATREPEKVGHESRRVLIIDDNVDAADSLRELLELDAHQVEVAYSGLGGLDKAREFKPEVVLCDIGLPDVGGYDVAKAIRGDPDPSVRSAYLVALTGYALPEDLARASESGFDQHLAKPPELEKLEHILASCHGKQR
jgi:two-component system NtrC family sensor kinase